MALRFVVDREVLATTALGHILRSSATATRALRDLLRTSGVAIPGQLAYRTEEVVPGELGRPDIVGAVGSERHLIIEGKFWATLTDNQPVEYLRKLVDGGCLLFVIPQPRFATVGAEIVRRCRAEDLIVSQPEDGRGFSRVGPSGWWLGVLGWRTVLAHLGAALSDAGEARLAADVDQLASLAELVDTDAFLPLSSMDLSNPTPLRVYQYMELAEDLVACGVEKGRLDVKGLRTAAARERYRRYARVGSIQIAVVMDLLSWARLRHTPLWLELYVEPGDAFRTLEAEQPPRLLLDGYGGRPYVPLFLPLGVERDAVVQEL